MSNELTNQTGNQLAARTIKEDYMIIQGADGKFIRKAVYHPFSSVVAETKEQKINLMNLLSSDDVATPMGEAIGSQLEIADVIFNPYDKVDEETGEIEHGVLSYIITPKGVAYVTSSKSVYFSLKKKIFQVFGEPHYNEDEVIKVEIVKKKGKEHQFIDIKILG